MRRLGTFVTWAVLLSPSGCREQDGQTVTPAEPVPAQGAGSEASDEVATPAEESVKPGINDAWRSDDVDPLIDRLESDDREIYANREALTKIVAAKPGSVVADVGSGSGFMTVELARAVGPEGKVYAVDINPKLLDKVQARAEAAKVSNVETVLTPETSIELPAASIDLMFICDTYHHFEYPKSVLGSIFEVLKPGGELVVVDFERIEGKSEDWILEHVRAGKEATKAEITTAGFELVEEHDVPSLVQNYVLRFRRP